MKSVSLFCDYFHIMQLPRVQVEALKEPTLSAFLCSLFGFLFHLLVDDMQSESVTGALHLCNVIRKFFDSVHLLVQEVGLQEVGQMGIPVFAGHLVQVQQGLKTRKRRI